MPSSDHARTDANLAGTCQEIDAPLTQRRSGPVLFRLIGPNGEFGGLFSRAAHAGEAAKRAWPGVEQKDSEDGPGWDVETVPSGVLRNDDMSEWRPIDTAPRDGTRVLATGGGLDDTVEVISYNERVGAWNTENYTLDDRDDEAEGYSRPSHWMPLPAPPAA
jgi:hypothetical protein